MEETAIPPQKEGGLAPPPPPHTPVNKLQTYQGTRKVSREFWGVGGREEGLRQGVGREAGLDGGLKQVIRKTGRNRTAENRDSLMPGRQ